MSDLESRVERLEEEVGIESRKSVLKAESPSGGPPAVFDLSEDVIITETQKETHAALAYGTAVEGGWPTTKDEPGEHGWYFRSLEVEDR